MEFSRWQEHGVCADMYARNPGAAVTYDLDFFGRMGRPDEVLRGQRICRDCPVKQLCLEDAVAHDESFGIWGGLDYTERKALYPTTRMVLLRQAFENQWLDRNRLSRKDRKLVREWEAAQAQTQKQAQRISELEFLVSQPLQEFSLSMPA